VSLTSQICKIVESVLRDKLVLHLKKHNLLQPSQHGFRSGFSCGSNLLSFLETITSLVDAKENVDANRWNSLSQDDIDAATVNSFKNRLDIRRKRQMDFFKD